MTSRNPTFSVEQIRFLALHARRLVVKWIWLFGRGTLRAWDEHGQSASITAAGFDDLCDRGFVSRLGEAGAKLTDLGWKVAA